MQDMVQNANAKPATGVVATLIGVVTLLFGASGVFGQLQTSLNAIWDVEPKPGRGILGLVRDRILSFGFILVVGFLLLVSLLLTAAVAVVAQWFGMRPAMETLAQILNFVLSLAVITLLFAMIFKFLPDAKIAWHDVWIGAFITALLFTVGKFALGLYLGKSALARRMGQQARSSSCSYGFIIPRRSFFSEPSSPRFMRTDLARTWLLPTMLFLCQSMHNPRYFVQPESPCMRQVQQKALGLSIRRYAFDELLKGGSTPTRILAAIACLESDC